MADDENLLRRAFEGGLPQLALGKHASDAIGRLIAGATDVPAAVLEGWAERIRDETRARSSIKAAQAAVVVDEVRGDSTLSERARARWLGAEVRKQENREAVAQVALEDLREDPCQAEDPVGDDFMNRFESYAEQASSDELRKLLGRVLSGEIRKPGSFSLATLHILSLIDAPRAQALQRVKSWVVDENTIPISNAIIRSPVYDDVTLLADLGIVRPDQLKQDQRENEEGSGFAVVASSQWVFKLSLKLAFGRFNCLALSPQGVELMTIVPSLPPETDVRDALARAFFDGGLIAKVEAAARVPSPPGTYQSSGPLTLLCIQEKPASGAA